MTDKILFVIGSLDVGGAERHIVQVVPNLLNAGFVPIVYTLAYKGKQASILEGRGVKVMAPPFAETLRGLPAAVRWLVLLPLSYIWLFITMWRIRPKVVHFFLPAAYLMGGLCSLMVPVPLRGMSRRSLNDYQSKYPALTKIEKWLHKKMDFILGNSVPVVAQLRGEGVPVEKLGLIYNGIDLSGFQNLANANEVRRQNGISESALVLTMVANLIPYKGHVDLIRALAAVKESLPDDWVMLCVGRDTGYGRTLRQLAADCGVADKIKWLGERADVPAIYSASDIGILCSHQEGFSNSVLEGMAAGAAMVVTDVGGNAEAVLPGECGLVVPMRTPDALGNAILTVAKDKEMRLRLVKAAQQRVREKFSLDTCVSQYARLYQRLLHEPQRRVQDAIDSA